METKRTLLFVLVAAFLCHEIDGRFTKYVSSGDDTRLEVYDGEETDIKNFPFTVSIMVDSDDDDGLYVGTIVSNKWVVTAANWTYRVSPAQVTVYAGSKSSGEGKEYTISRIVKQPQYKLKNYHYQIACIEINGNFKWSSSVAKVYLPSEPVKANTNFLVAGYGKDGVNGDSLRFGAMNWMGSKFCSDTFKDWGIAWGDRLACAYNRSSTTLCQGDVGIGFVKNQTLHGLFIGAVDEDLICSEKAYPIILANIYPAVDWIQQTTGAQYRQ